MRKGLVISALILGLCASQAAFCASEYFPKTTNMWNNTKNAFKTDVENAKKQAEADAAKKQAEQKAAYEAKKKAQEEALKKKMEPAAQAKKDYDATKNDINNIMKRFSK